MRIVHANKYAHVTGGADKHCLDLALVLRERGHEVRFLSTRAAENDEADGIFVTPTVTADTRDDLRPPARLVVARRAFWNPDAARAMHRLIETFRPEVLHTHKLYPQLSVAPIVIASRAGIRVVQTLHDYELVSASWADVRGGKIDRDETRADYRLLNSALHPFRRRFHVRRVDAFVSLSRLVARIHLRHGVASTVIPHFVSPHPSGLRLPGFEGRNGIVFVGRVTEEKGVRDVVELARRLPDVPVKVIGSGPLLRELQQSAARLPNLSVDGFLPPPEIPQHVAGARLAVVPSLWQEPGALVPLEAMALGTPVVAYANGGLAEYVSDAGGGRLVPPDVESLASACKELLSDEETWSKLSRRALSGVAERHAPERYAEQLEAVYAGRAPS